MDGNFMEPEEGKYMDQCYGRELTDKEIHELLNSLTESSVTGKVPKVRVFSVGWNENLNRVTYFRLESVDKGTTFLVSIRDGKFRVRQETEDYKKYRVEGIPLHFTL